PRRSIRRSPLRPARLQTLSAPSCRVRLRSVLPCPLILAERPKPKRDARRHCPAWSQLQSNPQPQPLQTLPPKPVESYPGPHCRPLRRSIRRSRLRPARLQSAASCRVRLRLISPCPLTLAERPRPERDARRRCPAWSQLQSIPWQQPLQTLPPKHAASYRGP